MTRFYAVIAEPSPGWTWTVRNLLWMSTSSSHEGKTSIYLAKLRLDD